MKYLILALFCMLAVQSQAQKPPKTQSSAKLAKEAAELEKQGNYMKAAVYYETAYAEKEENLEWIYKAGTCYLYVRDYANAAKCLADVKEQQSNAKFDKPAYKYAIALKQSGQYNEARAAFEEFIAQYKGADLEKMRKIVDTEIKGCSFALKNKETATATTSIIHLPAAINTEQMDFAPVAFNDGVLYFTSTKDDKAAIYRSQKVNSNWMRANMPDIFAGKMEKPNFGNAAFTPDGKRLYFTQCDLSEGGKPTCAIYAMIEEDGKWGNPVKLPDYINAANASSSQPNICIDGDKEILYFSSNRDGGKGGFDLWYCSRPANSNGFNFTLPKNLGNNINTTGDEMTPFFHTPSSTLYFSSDGWITAGGLDIFKSQGSQLKWEIVQNMGFPINSPADDLYFIISESHGGGYLVSNRTAEPNKVATTNDDIFYYGENKIEVTVKGKVFDCASKANGDAQTLTDVNIKLFERTEDGTEELIENKMLAVAEYKFVLQPKKNYLVEISRESYATASFEISTFEFNRTETHTKDLCLEIPSLKIEDIRAMIVPLEHNSKQNPYQLPSNPPTDPKTKEPYAEGTPVYEEFKRIEGIASTGTDGKVHYDGDGGEIIAYIPDVVAVVETPKKDPKSDKINKKDPKPDKKDPKQVKKDKRNGARENFAPEQYTDEPANIAFRLQVIAVRKLREDKYKELKTINGLRLEYEPTDDGLTRVMLVPENNNDDGTTGFKSKARALDALIFIVNNYGTFKTAFIAKYENGSRVGDAIRGWEE
jgi:tetratricopeptide (TPR) repeat protein